MTRTATQPPGSIPSYSSALNHLNRHRQGHVLAFWDTLDNDQRESLLGQIADLDLDAVDRCHDLLNTKCEEHLASLEVAPVTILAGDERVQAIERGERSIRDGNVGVVVVAGGQGSRLGFDGPKGAYGIGPVSGVPLFHVHAHKILALERKYNAEVPFYIMTSQANDEDTRQFFDEHDYFGLSRDRVDFFTQGMWPALTSDGHIILDRPDHIFMSPDGHGGIISAMKRRGVLSDMNARGVQTVFYFQVDNPMVDIADTAFIGFHEMNHAEISLKVCAKRDASEPVGSVVTKDGRNAVVEYTELTDHQRHETLPDGTLKFLYGSPAIHAFQLSFLEGQAEIELPIHIQHKKVPYCDKGRTVAPDSPNAYKFEKFIFDIIPRAERSFNLAFSRKDEFSPVKNAEGPDSPDTAKGDLTKKFSRWLEQCGVQVPRSSSGEPVYRIEIDPVYALTAEDLNDRVSRDLDISGDLFLG
jgi:UDP-N-acetylglucosamine/UDP-N-acetylgalactosamine diphosphorylase